VSDYEIIETKQELLDNIDMILSIISNKMLKATLSAKITQKSNYPYDYLWESNTIIEKPRSKITTIKIEIDTYE